jgi:hypothetical protein
MIVSMNERAAAFLVANALNSIDAQRKEAA